MKRIGAGIILLFALLFTLPLAAVSAQDTDTLDDFTDTGGLESAVSRSWTIDFSTLTMATPEAEATTPDLLMVIAMVMRYDSSGNAAKAFESFRDDTSGQPTDDALTEEAKTLDLNDIGDQAVVTETTAVETEGTWISRVAASQEGDLLYVVMAIGGDAHRVANADSLLSAMVNDADPGSGEGTYTEDGTSTGGLWDVMPATDHEALIGLVNLGDAIIFPEPDDAPA